ncbi:MAG: hypothetical protein NDI61_10000 [Bdellovibrionaceae bacterium]|nr:hypothetical protein [Pseudobdellovibrionaceae bacterium]
MPKSMPKSKVSKAKVVKAKAPKAKSTPVQKQKSKVILAKTSKLQSKAKAKVKAAPQGRVAKKLVSKPGRPTASPASFMRRLLEERKRQREELQQKQQASGPREDQRENHLRHVSFSRFAGPRRRAA